MNTSFNLKDQTITLTVDQAIHRFKQSEMDALVIGNILIEKTKGNSSFDNYFEESSKSEDAYKNKLKEMRKRDPFVYKHF